MATNSLQSLNYRHHTPPLGRRQSIDTPPPTLSLTVHPNTGNATNNLPTKKISISSAVKTFAVSPTTSTSAAQSTTFDLLHRLLAAKNFREADDETRRLLIALAGDAAQKRGYVFFSEVQFISESDLQTIDQLWRNHSNNRFGYSVQKRLWEKADKDFTKFFIKVGWMKKLDTEILQYNYRAFPDEFTWELDDETPEGHLPLTNALRGTQLLTCILSHPAFAEDEEEGKEEIAIDEEKQEKKQPVRKGLFNTNYSF